MIAQRSEINRRRKDPSSTVLSVEFCEVLTLEQSNEPTLRFLKWVLEYELDREIVFSGGQPRSGVVGRVVDLDEGRARAKRQFMAEQFGVANQAKSTSDDPCTVVPYWKRSGTDWEPNGHPPVENEKAVGFWFTLQKGVPIKSQIKDIERQVRAFSKPWNKNGNGRHHGGAKMEPLQRLLFSLALFRLMRSPGMAWEQALDFLKRYSPARPAALQKVTKGKRQLELRWTKADVKERCDEVRKLLLERAR